MPQSVSLENSVFKIKSKNDYLGVPVPWEVTGYLEDLAGAETVGGIFDFSSWATIEIAGPDARDFLQRMSTVNFKNFQTGETAYGAFLTGKGTVVSIGMFVEEKGSFRFIVTPNQEAATLEHIEKFHFQENITIRSLSNEWAVLGWWNPRADLLDDMHLERAMPVRKVDWRRWKSLDLFVWRDPKFPELFWIHLLRRSAQPFLFEIQRLGIPLLGQRLFEYYRMQYALPQVGIEVHDKEIILETGFEESVARNKGCYPGQEVVERIFTYGSVNRMLKKVTVEGSGTLPVSFESGGKEVATLVSMASDPRKPKTALGLAYLNKSEWEAAHEYQNAGITVRYTPSTK